VTRPSTVRAKHIPSESAPPITSRENRWLRRFRAALSGDRGEDGTVGVEGVRLVEAALGSGLPVEALLVSVSGERHLPRIAAVLALQVPVLRTSDKLFAGIADTRTPQGIAALVRPRQVAIENLLTRTALVVVLVGVQDPGNVGTIIRAAEAFGATGAATCAGGGISTADPFAPKALRASAGSALRLPIVHGIATTILLTQLRISGVRVCAAVAPTGEGEFKKQESVSPNPLLAPWGVDWKIPSAILIGNEGAGLPGELERSADARVYIPQAIAATAVGVESLNAAMAASVLLYEAMRQRDSTRNPSK
jgi:TrmH family RNA methyltransferase